MKIVVFEDNNFNNFYPISLTRPVWDLRTGCFLQRERIERFFPGGEFYYFTRDYLVPLFREKYPELIINDFSVLNSGQDILFINAAAVPSGNVVKKKNVLMKRGNIPVAGLIESSKMTVQHDIIQMLDSAQDINIEESSIEMYDFIWDLIHGNAGRITEDFGLYKTAGLNNPDDTVAVIGDRNNVLTGSNVRIDPFVCIDASGGPVIIESDSVINSFTRIEGPCYIGSGCTFLGAKIREGCSFGNNCRIGGEVEESIFQSYSNKYHDGFLGHAYAGEWVNLGAMTANSDLKNNYNNVRVYIPPKWMDTGSIKVGCFIGDFTKTSIGTLITTGASIGTGAMIIHSGRLTPYHIPPFAWYAGNRVIDPGLFNNFIETCRKQTSRRSINFSVNFVKMLTELYKLTEETRQKEVSRWKTMKK